MSAMEVNCGVGECHNVFVYGSLLADEVVHVLLKRLPTSASATLHDQSVTLSLSLSLIITLDNQSCFVVWFDLCCCSHRFKIKGRVYPAILPVESKKVTGRVLLGISGAELDILDDFEDVEYTRTDVEVFLIVSLAQLLFILFHDKWATYCCIFQKALFKIHYICIFRTILIRKLKIMVQDNSEKLQVHTYVWSNPSDPNLYGEWDFEVSMLSFLFSFAKLKMNIICDMFYGQKTSVECIYSSVFSFICWEN